MKPRQDIRHEGTVGDEGRTRMDFDKDSIAHLMSVLTDLYSDPALWPGNWLGQRFAKKVYGTTWKEML